jgi:hypothetical protein
LNKRASRESISGDANQAFPQYIAQQEEELKMLKEEEEVLLVNAPDTSIKPDIIEAARGWMKDFVNRIRIEPPDVQWQMIKQCVKAIVLDESVRQYKMTVVIPGGTEREEPLLETTRFFAL